MDFFADEMIERMDAQRAIVVSEREFGRRSNASGKDRGDNPCLPEEIIDGSADRALFAGAAFDAAQQGAVLVADAAGLQEPGPFRSPGHSGLWRTSLDNEFHSAQLIRRCPSVTGFRRGSQTQALTLAGAGGRTQSKQGRDR